jgi:hypothetical protein
MPALKSLAFTTMPKTASDPVHIRRAKFIDKLEEQKLKLLDAIVKRRHFQWALALLQL